MTSSGLGEMPQLFGREVLKSMACFTPNHATHTHQNSNAPEIQMTGKDNSTSVCFNILIRVIHSTISIDILISHSTISTRGQPDQQKCNSENEYQQDAGIPRKGKERTSKHTKDTHLHTSLKFVINSYGEKTTDQLFVIGHYNRSPWAVP